MIYKLENLFTLNLNFENILDHNKAFFSQTDSKVQCKIFSS